MTDSKVSFDAVLMVAFGGPEKLDDVRPFLTYVTRGRVPWERLKTVASHYDIFGGKSPVNEVTQKQADALALALNSRGVSLPVYVGMRNWRPFLDDTVAKMNRDGIKQAAVVIMSVFQSSSSWNQYEQAIIDAIEKTGAKLDVFYAKPVFDHPGFLKTVAKNVLPYLSKIPRQDRDKACILFSIHSLPKSDSGVDLYVEQINHTASRVCRELNLNEWKIAYQSRSGRPQDPWLEPDINDVLRDLADQRVKYVIVVPIGFVCDNIEVLYDLDTQARQTAKESGITFFRAKTVNDDPVFIDALADLVLRAK